MASHYSANQYEDAFNSKKLRNWTVPRKYKEHPSTLEGYTMIIANDRGHLNEQAPRSKENPWGTFMGTWDMPCKIPPARPSYTARSPDAVKNLYKIKQTSPLNNAVNGYKKFDKSKKLQTSPVQRPHAPSPPTSDRKVMYPSTGVVAKSPKAQTPRKSPGPVDDKPPTPAKVPTPRCSPRVRSPTEKAPTPANSATPRGSNAASPRPESEVDVEMADHRSVGSAHTV